MNKQEFIKFYAEKTGIPVVDAIETIEHLIEAIIEATEKQPLKLAGFGQFYRLQRESKESTEIFEELKFKRSAELPEIYWRAWYNVKIATDD
ncbi:MAG: HU family DNA-binding protein [Pseudomonadota bacterium]